jgi:hypothetical protein
MQKEAKLRTRRLLSHCAIMSALTYARRRLGVRHSHQRGAHDCTTHVRPSAVKTGQARISRDV